MLLDNRAFLVKRRNKGNILMANWVHEIFDPETEEMIANVQEEYTGIYKVLGRIIKKRFLPRQLIIQDTKTGEKAFSFNIAAFSSKVSIFDGENNLIGKFDNKFLGGCFYFVNDADGTEIGQIKGNIMVKEFSLLSPHEQEIGAITKSWHCEGKDVVCKSTSFIVALVDNLAYRPEIIKMLLLAAGISLDIALMKK